MYFVLGSFSGVKGTATALRNSGKSLQVHQYLSGHNRCGEGSFRHKLRPMGILNAKCNGEGCSSHPTPVEDESSALESFDYDPEEWSSVVPKSEIQATAFLKEYPEFDGRGVVIAILDTGVDPGASGLQTTTTGEKKIIDVVDCTGSGDVDMSTIRELDADGCLEGIYGNKMKVDPSWKNPKNTWHVGSKRVYELFPEGLKHRMKKERKTKLEEHHNVLLNKASLALSEFNAKNPSIGAGDHALRREKEELEAKVDVLTQLFKTFEDFGPSIDCVVWHDGEQWLAAIETTQLYSFFEEEDVASDKGSLDAFEPLTNYRDCLRYGTFSALDACNFAVNIYDEGKILNLVCDAGSHGTHVAGISAGHYPNDTFVNGIAPGAKIVSCKIGDTRLGSMETMTGLTRAYQAIIQNKCDLINMSYGEAASWPDTGRFVRLADELVHKHGVIFVASAGNAGPALSTVGAPGGTSNSIMSIGAYVTPDLAKSGHSVRHPIESGAQYTWSSRGPTADGDIGVSISAPGGAITTVPQWTTQKKQLMNGTSMSSPCACGGLALVVSAMKATGMPVTPSLVRRAAENSAMPVDPKNHASALTYGRGLLQVNDCWNYLRQCSDSKLAKNLPDLRFVTSVTRSDGHYSGRGVYLREPADSKENRTFSVMVKPELHEDADVRDHKLDIDLKLRLSSTADWVVAPKMLMLHHNGRMFEIEVNCERLGYGLHYAEIEARESSDPMAGPLFRIPVCVVKPHLLSESAGSLEMKSPDLSIRGTTVSWASKIFVPGKEDREYIMVPQSATWAEMIVRPIEVQPSMACMIRATSLEPHTRYSDTEYRSFARLTHGMEHQASFPVVSGSTLEIAVSQFWSSFGTNKVSVDLTFHAVSVQPAKSQSFVTDDSSLPMKAIVHAPIRSEVIKPVCKFGSLIMFARPSKSEMTVMSDPRNSLPGNRYVHNLVLTYEVSFVEGGKITPRIPKINSYVYDGELSGQITIVTDKNKQVIGVGDIYPHTMQVKKGDYNVIVCLRHENPSFLKEFENQVLQIEKSISDLSAPIYGTYSNAIRGTDELKKMTLGSGEKSAIFVGKLSGDLPKDAGPGKILKGTLKCAGNSEGKQAPGSHTIVYTCASKEKASTDSKPESKPKESIEEKMRAAKVGVLQKLSDDDEEYDALYKSLLAEYPDHLPILLEELKRADKMLSSSKEEGRSSFESRLMDVCDKILSLIDQSKLAIFVAKKNLPEEDPDTEKLKQDMKIQKEALIKALVCKCQVLLKSDGATTMLKDSWTNLREWVDTSSDKDYLLLHAKYEINEKNYALGIKTLNKIIDADEMHKDLKEALDLRKKILADIGFKCWEIMEGERMRSYFPLNKLTL
jgi:tripeptidyl-peptidase-2